MAQEEVEEVSAGNVEVDDEVFFPNSRNSQVVQSLMRSESATTLYSGDAQWVIPNHMAVRRVVRGDDA